MGRTAKALVPPLMRGSIERVPVTTLSLSDLLARTHSLNVKQICQLARFVPVIILIPESCLGRVSIRMLQGTRNLLGQNSFWLRRADLSRRNISPR
jgi:hypothetical protein